MLKRLKITLFIACLAALYTPFAALASPPVPYVTEGTVKLAGGNVPVGTLITASCGDLGWGMGAFMIVPAIILILIIVVAIGGLEEKTVYVQQQQSPLDILNQRLARGEISQEEYERIRTRLAQ